MTFWSSPISDILAALSTSVDDGLTSPAAQQRLQETGPNQLAAEPPEPVWRKFLAQFQDAMVVILLIAGVVSLLTWFIERDSFLPYESFAIFAIVLLNALLGYLQEEQAAEALAALQSMNQPEANVLRDGRVVRIASSEIVPGDILALFEGDSISADARLLSIAGLRTLESSLTGESAPVSKRLDPLPADTVPGDRVNMVFSGTAVAEGHARAVVTATGMNTELGKIAGLLHTTERELTPLQRQLNRTGKQLGLISLALAIVVTASMLLRYGVKDHKTIIDALLFGVALAVSATPEGLATVVAVVLSLGVKRMAARGAIVRRLPTVETLGSASVIATDKTGTLTNNEMTVRIILVGGGEAVFTGSGYEPSGTVEGLSVGDQELRALLHTAVLSNNAELEQEGGRWQIRGDPTEGALLVAARKAGIHASELRARHPRVSENPFSSIRKMMSAVHHNPDGSHTLHVKGAADVLLALCTAESFDGVPRPLTGERRAAIHAANERLASRGLRTLGYASRQVSPGDGEELHLIFLGLTGMMDPPRKEARPAVAKARQAHVRTLMITGDHPSTALSVARELGIESSGEALTGHRIEAMTDGELKACVTGVAVYARVSPEHKLRIVKALRSNDEIVAMTGDGVNDAPALKAADIGVAMGMTGSDVAKQAADLVLTDDNFATIVAAVEEGRGIFQNIRKFLTYLLSSNAGEVLTIFAAVMLEDELGLSSHGEFVLPLVATQILWVNLITDSTPALALGVEPVETGLMTESPRPVGEHIVSRPMLWRILLVAVVIAAGTLYVFDASLPGGFIEGTGGLGHARTMAFTVLTFFQIVNALNSRSLTASAFVRPFSNPWMWAAIAFSVCAHLLILYVPPLARAFSATPLTVPDWILCIAISSTVLWTVEIAKLINRRR